MNDHVAEQQGGDESGEGLGEAEREALLRAWPWPSESATTEGGFGAVESAVQCIIAARDDEWRESHKRAEAALATARREADEMRAVGRELLALKDGPRGADYERRKPLAWDALRAALANPSAEGGANV